MNGRLRIIVPLVLLMLLATNEGAHACPSCYGDPESPMTEGMNMAIISLLGVTGGVLVGVVGFFVYLRHRIRSFNERFANRLN